MPHRPSFPDAPGGGTSEPVDPIEKCIAYCYEQDAKRTAWCDVLPGPLAPACRSYYLADLNACIDDCNRTYPDPDEPDDMTLPE